MPWPQHVYLYDDNDNGYESQAREADNSYLVARDRNYDDEALYARGLSDGLLKHLQRRAGGVGKLGGVAGGDATNGKGGGVRGWFDKKMKASVQREPKAHQPKYEEKLRKFKRDMKAQGKL